MPSLVAARHGGDLPATDRYSPPDHRSRPLSSRQPAAWRLAPVLLLTWLATGAALAQTASPASGYPVAPLLPPASEAGGEANLIVPSLSDPSVSFLGMTGSHLLMIGLFVCILGMIFGLMVFTQLRDAPVHPSMREISELIYETCKTYLVQQLKFVAILELFIGAIIVVYFGILQQYFVQGKALQVAIILLFSLVGIAGSASVAAFGIRVNTFANSRTAFAALRGKPFPCYSIPLKAGMSIGMLLI